MGRVRTVRYGMALFVCSQAPEIAFLAPRKSTPYRLFAPRNRLLLRPEIDFFALRNRLLLRPEIGFRLRPEIAPFAPRNRVPFAPRNRSFCAQKSRSFCAQKSTHFAPRKLLRPAHRLRLLKRLVFHIRRSLLLGRA